MQGLDGGRVELIGATVAGAVNGLDGACNSIGGGGCPIRSIAIGGCSMPWTVARIAAGLDIWQGLPVAYGIPWTLYS